MLLLKNISDKIEVTIFSDNIGNVLSAQDYETFCKEYPHVRITLKRTGGKYHDRFIFPDYGTRSAKLYHCGGSSKDGGKRITAISRKDNIKIYADLMQNDIETLRMMFENETP